MFEVEENSEVRAFRLYIPLKRKRESEREMAKLDSNSGLCWALDPRSPSTAHVPFWDTDGRCVSESSGLMF